MNKNIVFVVLIVFLSSCTYKLIVNKRNIVQDINGYLVFNNDQVVFFPSNDTVDADFLADKHKNGYEIEYRTAWLKKLSTDYSNLLYIQNDKRLSMIPVVLTCYLGEMWQKKGEHSTIDYKWENKTYAMNYKIDDWRQILSISVVRGVDKRRLDTMQIEVPTPSHHWD